MRRFAATLAIVLASTAIGLAGFELFLRATGYSAPLWYQPDAHLGWTLRPGAQGVFSAEGRADVSVNDAGFRDRTHPLDKPSGVYRIAVLGDSYSEAMQVPLEAAYWSLLPGKLAACGFQPGRKIEALNFGVAGYGTAQQYLLLVSTAIRYQPDLVLLQFTNGNDVRNNSAVLEPEKSRPFFALDERGTLRLDESFAYTSGHRRRSSLPWQLFREVSDASRVAQLLRAASQAQLMPSAHASPMEAGLEAAVLAEPRDPLWRDAWRTTEVLIEKTHDFARRHGADFLLVSVPYAVQVHPDRKLRASLQEKLGVPDLLYPDRRIAAFAADKAIPALTLAPGMQARAEASGVALHGFANAQPGFGHWNEEGHRVAAELIAQRLCR